MADLYFADRIDEDRIAALGFSLGGSTVMGVGGLRLDAESYADYCETFGEARTGLFVSGAWRGRFRPPAAAVFCRYDR